MGTPEAPSKKGSSGQGNKRLLLPLTPRNDVLLDDEPDSDHDVEEEVDRRLDQRRSQRRTKVPGEDDDSHRDGPVRYFRLPRVSKLVLPKITPTKL